MSTEYERVKNRMEGFLSTLRQPSVKDRLHALLKVGAVTEPEIKAWESLRHPSAHAGSLKDRAMQDVLDLYHVVSVLMYHLVFRAIGYVGP